MLSRHPKPLKRSFTDAVLPFFFSFNYILYVQTTTSTANCWEAFFLFISNCLPFVNLCTTGPCCTSRLIFHLIFLQVLVEVEFPDGPSASHRGNSSGTDQDAVLSHQNFLKQLQLTSKRLVWTVKLHICISCRWKMYLSLQCFIISVCLRFYL